MTLYGKLLLTLIFLTGVAGGVRQNQGTGL